MALPLLPGFSFNKNIGREKFHLSQYLEKRNGVPYLFGDNKLGVGGDLLPGQRFDPPKSNLLPGNTNRIPAFVAYDKQVLQFEAYFQESVNEKREERYRIRQCNIYFYLEDDTIQVVEPRVRNSGLPQGTILKRHRLKKPSTEELYYTVHDFNIGIEVDFYGRVYRIVSCDEFTEKFLRKLGVKVNKPEVIPKDPFSSVRKATEGAQHPLRPYEKIDTLKQFLDHDRHVLRFYCVWDDTKSLDGDVRFFELTYFLADDTMQLKECIAPNSGRDSVNTFLKRAKVPKGTQPIPLPGSVTERTLLNVLGHPQRGGRYLVDNLRVGKLEQEFYNASDLTIGASLDIYGRKFVITDCDEFTKQYYKDKYGIENFNPAEGPKRDEGMPIMKMVYPYNGWGTYEDSLNSCNTLMPKPQKTDFNKFMKKDKCGLESNVLRFVANLRSSDSTDKNRKFIISVFLSDDTVQVFESKIPNNGFACGKFAKREKVVRPGQARYLLDVPEYYKPGDFYVGATVKIHEFDFDIVDADFYAYDVMESEPHNFPKSNISLILQKLKPLCRGMREELKQLAVQYDLLCSKTISFSDFCKIINCILSKGDIPLVMQEVITLARKFSGENEMRIDKNQVFGIAQLILKKLPFDDYQGLKEQIIFDDLDRTGVVPKESIIRNMKACRAKLPKDLLEHVLVHFADQNGNITYEPFLSVINWRNRMCSQDVIIPEGYTGNLEVDWMKFITGAKSRIVSEKMVSSLQQPPAPSVKYMDFIEAVTN